MKNIFVIGLISIFVFGACSTVKMESDPKKASPVIVYSKGPCFGKCPIFTMTIYNTGLVKYYGRRYTTKNGKHEKMLDKAAYTDLVKSFRKNRFWRFDDTYGMDLVDAPTTTISFSDNDKVGLSSSAVLKDVIETISKKIVKIIVSESCKDPAEHFLEKKLDWSTVKEIEIDKNMINNKEEVNFNLVEYLKNRTF